MFMAIGAGLSEVVGGLVRRAEWRASRVELREMHAGAVAFRYVFRDW